MTISDKIRTLRESLPGRPSQVEIGRAVWPEDTEASVQGRMKRIENGKRGVTTEEAKRFSEIFSISLYDLLEIDEAPSNFFLIPKYKTRLSGGPGAYVLTEEIEREFAFRSDWLAKKCTFFLSF